MLQTTFLLPISNGGVLPTENPVDDSKCCKQLFTCPLAMGSRTHLNSSALLQILQTTFHLPFSKGGVLPTQTPVHDSRCFQTTFLLLLSKRGVLATQTPVYYSRCCKRLFSYPLARGESYPTQTLVHDCRFYKRLFTCPLAKGKSYPPKL